MMHETEPEEKDDKSEPKNHPSPLIRSPKGGIIKIPDDYEHIQPQGNKPS